MSPNSHIKRCHLISFIQWHVTIYGWEGFKSALLFVPYAIIVGLVMWGYEAPF